MELRKTMKHNKSIIVALICVITYLACTPQSPTKSEVIVTPAKVAKVVYPSDVTNDFIMGKFDPSIDTTFTTISSDYSDRNGLLMKKEAYEAFLKMHAAAKKDGINLVIRSAVRNFDYQKTIWEKKWTGKTILSNGQNASVQYPDPVDRARKILEYSSMPGTSRHHWGSDIDFNSFNNEWFSNGEGLKLFSWLEKNAMRFGYCRPYTTKNADRPHGYNEEKWHWTYLPLSTIYTSYAKDNLTTDMIKGFAGSKAAADLNVVEHYVLGINKSCSAYGTNNKN